MAIWPRFFLKVFAEHDENGKTKPLALTWTDGKRSQIDRVADSGQRSIFVRGRGEMVFGEVEGIIRLFRRRDIVAFSPQYADIFGGQAVKQKNLQEK